MRSAARCGEERLTTKLPLPRLFLERRLLVSDILRGRSFDAGRLWIITTVSRAVSYERRGDACDGENAIDPGRQCFPTTATVPSFDTPPLLHYRTDQHFDRGRPMLSPTLRHITSTTWLDQQIPAVVEVSS